MASSSEMGSTTKGTNNRGKKTSISSSHITKMAAGGALKTLATSVLTFGPDNIVSAATGHELTYPLSDKLKKWFDKLSSKDQLRLALLQWNFNSRIPVPFCRELVEVAYGYPTEKAKIYEVIWEQSDFCRGGPKEETLEEFTFALDDVLTRCREQIRAQAIEDGVNETLFSATLRLLCAPESSRGSIEFITTHVFDYCLACFTDERKPLNRPVVDYWLNKMGAGEHIDTSIRVLRSGTNSDKWDDIKLGFVVSVGFKAMNENRTDANQQNQDNEILNGLCNGFRELYMDAKSLSAVAVRQRLQMLLPELYQYDERRSAGVHTAISMLKGL